MNKLTEARKRELVEEIQRIAKQTKDEQIAWFGALSDEERGFALTCLHDFVKTFAKAWQPVIQKMREYFGYLSTGA